MTTQELYDKLVLELDRSLVVEESVSDYWLKNYKTLPVSAVEFFYNQLVQINRHVDDMIAAGIDAHPELAAQISQKGKDAKKKFMKFLEKQETKEENPEEFLQANLS